MQAQRIVELLRARRPVNQNLEGYVPKQPFPEDLAVAILNDNAAKIDAAIMAATLRQKNCVTLADWEDHCNPGGLLGVEFDALRSHDLRATRSQGSAFSRVFTNRLHLVIRRWVLERYAFQADFRDASDGCNDAWVITFQKPFETAEI